MSRVGHCIDNGPMEGFWGILKCEMYYLNRFETYEALVAAVEQFIHYYNYQRRRHKEWFATSYIPQSSGGCLKNPGPHF